MTDETHHELTTPDELTAEGLAITQIAEEVATVLVAGRMDNIRRYYKIGSIISTHVSKARQAISDGTGDALESVKMPSGFYEDLAIKIADVAGTEDAPSTTSLRNWERLTNAFTPAELEQVMSVPGVSYSKLLGLIERAGDKLVSFDDKFGYLENESADKSANEFAQQLKEDFPTEKEQREKSQAEKQHDDDDDSDGSINLQVTTTKLAKVADAVQSLCADLVMGTHVDYEFDDQKRREAFFERVKEGTQICETMEKTFAETRKALHDFCETKFGRALSKKAGGPKVVSQNNKKVKQSASNPPTAKTQEVKKPKALKQSKGQAGSVGEAAAKPTPEQKRARSKKAYESEGTAG